MARQLRLNFAGAVQHVTSRGNNKQAIFFDDDDRIRFLDLFAEAIRHNGWVVTAWTLMTNHFHLVIETPDANLSAGMQWLLGTYVGWFNDKHQRCGHLFGGRFKSVLIDKESYLTRAIRYVALNPVKAKMVERPEDYRWSSYRATAGFEKAPSWLALSEVQQHFGETDTWQENYRGYVAEKIGSTERLWDEVVNQIYLGSEKWTARMRAIVESEPRSTDHPTAQRAVGRPEMAQVVAAVAEAYGQSASGLQEKRGGEARMLVAWLGWYEGWQRLSLIAAALRIRSSGHISNLIRAADEMLRWNTELQHYADEALATLHA